MQEKLEETIERYKKNDKEFIIQEIMKIFYESTEDDIKLYALKILKEIR